MWSLGKRKLLLRPRSSAAELLVEALEHERQAQSSEAIGCLEGAISAAERFQQPALIAEGLRRLSIIRYKRDERTTARSLAQRSFEVARDAGLDVVAGEALNTIGAQHLQGGALREARAAFDHAIRIGGESQSLCARAEQNLGIVANIQGRLDDAVGHYTRSLEAYRAGDDEHGCAIAYHNLGMVAADQDQLDDAEHYFQESQGIASRIGDLQLRAQCLTSRAELEVLRQRFENARQNAEEALTCFDRLGVRRGKADAYRVIGMVYREVGRLALAESRLSVALTLAVQSGATLIEAESARELAMVMQAMGRNQEALRLLDRAHRTFRMLEARHDMVNVAAKLASLQGMYLTVVRDWGRSIEANDQATYGHCERVARNAVAVARALGLPETDETAILVSAYLHDVGMMRVPHEILSKPTPLNEFEQAAIDLHTVWGDEMLSGVEFPWPVKQVVRWHHERYDGSGYPDKLAGDRIPISAQVVGILDYYDGLTTARFGQPALTPYQAGWEVLSRRSWWAPHVVEAFMKVIR